MHRTLASMVFATAVSLPLSAAGQSETTPQMSPFKQMKDYEEATYADVKSSIRTAAGQDQIRISLKKLRVEGREKQARIQLPERGLAMIQHRAGQVVLTINGKNFEPLEGEWLTLALPVELIVRPEDDAVLLDLILIEE